jgi:hypothetical protein
MKRLWILISLTLFFTIACNESRSPVESEIAENGELTRLAKTSYVPGDYETIQGAIDASVDGDIIIIKEGVYEELISIHDKNNITVIGENALIRPPDGELDGEGVFNLVVNESSDIVLQNLKFDGKIDEPDREYPIDRAIEFDFSSGAILNNTFVGYGLGIACYNDAGENGPIPDLMELIISNNNFDNCYGQIEITGNYDYEIDHNIIKYCYASSHTFDAFFPHWYGMLIEGGTGTISKNLIKLKSGSIYLVYSVGVRLMQREPANNYGIEMHDVDVMQNTIKGTDSGISVNSLDPLPVGETWCVHGVRLLYNTFVQVMQNYEIYNECEDVVILP